MLIFATARILGPIRRVSAMVSRARIRSIPRGVIGHVTILWARVRGKSDTHSKRDCIMVSEQVKGCLYFFC